MKLKKYSQIAFLIVAVLTILEFIYIRGMFTWLMVVLATIVTGGLNIILSLRHKEPLTACLYLVCVIALCMGYFTLII